VKLSRQKIDLHVYASFPLGNTAQSRHIAQKSLAIRQYACGISGQSAEKSDNAPYAQALCGIALAFFSTMCYTIHKRAAAAVSAYIKGNTAQSPPDGFARNLRANFPSYCPEIPCHTAVCLWNF